MHIPTSHWSPTNICFAARTRAAGLQVPALASAAPDDADAELIRLCDRLVQLRTHEVAQFKLIDDDDYDPLEGTGTEWQALADRVIATGLPPSISRRFLRRAHLSFGGRLSP